MYPHTIRRGAVIAALCATAALGLTACKSDGDSAASGSPSGTTATSATPSASPTTTPSPTPPALDKFTATQIISKATDAMNATQSLTADMKGISDGEPMTFRMSLNTKGRCTGRMTQDGGNVEIISTGTHFYLKGDDAFLRQMGEGAQQLLHGKWMKTASSSSTAKDMDGVCDLKELLAGLEDKPDHPAKGALTTLDGKRVIPITEKDPKDGSTSVAYVLADGAPYVVKVVTTGGKEPGTLLFSDFDQPVSVGAPPADQIVDIDKLGS